MCKNNMNTLQFQSTKGILSRLNPEQLEISREPATNYANIHANT